MRLNRTLLESLLSGAVVIHVATPTDTVWHGLPVSVAEGLEAGLIEKYLLPWNQRGTTDALSPSKAAPVVSTDAGPLAERIMSVIAKRPNMTEAEIARALFGADGYQQKVNGACRRLLASGHIERTGQGGPVDTYTYKAARRT